jgi:hypothetical protein
MTQGGNYDVPEETAPADESTPAAAPVDDQETGKDAESVEPFRVMPPPWDEPVAGDAEVDEPIEIVDDVPDVPETPPVSPDVERAARALGIQVWSSGSMPRAQLYQGRQAHSVDQYLAHAQSMRWLAVVGDLIARGEVDPRPVTVTRIPISSGRALFWGLLWNPL